MLRSAGLVSKWPTCQCRAQAAPLLRCHIFSRAREHNPICPVDLGQHMVFLPQSQNTRFIEGSLRPGKCFYILFIITHYKNDQFYHYAVIKQISSGISLNTTHIASAGPQIKVYIATVTPIRSAGPQITKYIATVTYKHSFNRYCRDLILQQEQFPIKINQNILVKHDILQIYPWYINQISISLV